MNACQILRLERSLIPEKMSSTGSHPDEIGNLRCYDDELAQAAREQTLDFRRRHFAAAHNQYTPVKKIQQRWIVGKVAISHGSWHDRSPSVG
jgi:hypothetical protein